MLLATFVALSSGCLDIRDFEGTWSGSRVGDDPVLQVGFAEQSSATLVVDDVDLLTLEGSLTTSGDELVSAEIRPIAGATADAISDMTFAGSPERVYLSFVEPTDGAGDALAIVALYNDDRVEVRILRGNPAPLYGVFALDRQ